MYKVKKTVGKLPLLTSAHTSASEARTILKLTLLTTGFYKTVQPYKLIGSKWVSRIKQFHADKSMVLASDVLCSVFIS